MDATTAKTAIDTASAALVTTQSKADQVGKQIETQKADLKKAMDELASTTKAAEEAAKLKEAAQAKAAAIQKMIDDSNAALKKAKEETAANQAKIDASKKMLAEAEMISKKSTAELEGQKKAAGEAETAKQKSASEVAKRKQALDTATLAQQRATAEIPKHESVVRSETTRQGLLDQRLASLQANLAASGNAVCDLMIVDDGIVVAARQDGSIDAFRVSDGHAIAEFSSENRHPWLARLGNRIFGISLQVAQIMVA